MPFAVLTKMDAKITWMLFGLLVLDLAHCRPSNLLKGTVVRNWPYADKINNRYEGFVVDLLDSIAQKVGFEYCLHSPADGKYGTPDSSGTTINGMVGEVFANQADLAIGDLEVTDARKRYVDFTEPFVENQLAAIVRNDDGTMQRFRTIQDLMHFNEMNQRDGSRPNQSYGPPIILVVIRNGAILDFLSKSSNPMARKTYDWIMKNPGQSLVSSANEGVERVLRPPGNARHAFLVESTFAEDVIGQNCNLSMLKDGQSMYPRNFAIALARGSPYLERFNTAIRDMRQSGEIEHLRQKYWTKHCHGLNDAEELDRRLPTPPSSPPQSPRIRYNNNNNINNNNNNVTWPQEFFPRYNGRNTVQSSDT